MDKPKADRRISDTVLYFYEGAFTLWRQRMAGICEEARKKGWRIQPVNVDIMTWNAKSVLDFWKPVGVIVDGGTLNRGGFAADSYAGIPAVFCDSDRMASGCETYCLRHDSESTARIAAKELLSLNSESLGFVSFHTPRDWSDTRRAVTKLSGVTAIGIAVDPADESRVWISASTWDGNKAGGIYESLDGCKTWKDITGDIPYTKPLVVRYNAETKELWAAGPAAFKTKR